MPRPSPSAVIALVALFVALGGPVEAAKLIGGDDVKKGAIRSKHVKDRSLKKRDLSAGAVRALTVTPNRSIVDAMLGDSAVTTRSLAPGSVLTGTVGDNSLTAADLAPSAAGPDEVADNAVGQTEIRNNGVGASELADNSIDGGEIIDAGLSVRDIARSVGTFEWPVGSLMKNTCEVKWVQVAGGQIAGDFVLISPTSTWPRDLVYTANGTSSETEFKVQACNRGELLIGAATYVFNFAVIGN
jgi:hypothetical protein